jgi:hypothetical protein
LVSLLRAHLPATKPNPHFSTSKRIPNEKRYH